MLLRRVKPVNGVRRFRVGDFVKHPTKGTGVVDAVSHIPWCNVFVVPWNGRGEKPRRANSDFFSAPPSMLTLADRPAEMPRRTRQIGNLIKR